MSRIVALIFIFSLCSSVLALNGINNHHRILSRHRSVRNPPHLNKRQDTNALLFAQKLNHFDNSDTRTFNQRYFVNDINWRTNGPIFLYVGGEISMASTDVIGTQFAKYAADNGAVLIALEHRFFGESQPFSDLSTANLRYLSVEQALADAANFITGFKASKNIGDVPVIAFGASYGGNLAVWLRQAYPEIFSSALGSSAPVQLTADFSEYLVSVTSSINSIMGNSDCTSNINQAVVAMESLMANSDNWSTVASQFGGCGGYFSQELDTRTFMGSLMELWQTAIQYNDQNKIRNYCSIMTNGGDPMTNLANVNKAELEADGTSCLNAFYSAFIDFYGSISITPGSGVVGYRQYFYLQCTQLGFFQTTSAAYPKQPFGTLVTSELYRSECKDVFGIDHDPAAASLNARFGGNKPQQTSQILFSNGALDPWSVLSVTSNGNGIVAVLIPGAGHCADIYAYYGENEFTSSQNQMGNQLKNWVSAFVPKGVVTPPTPTSDATPTTSTPATPTSVIVSPTSDAEASVPLTSTSSTAGVIPSNPKGSKVPSAPVVPSNVPTQSPSTSVSEQQDSSAISCGVSFLGVALMISILI
eukprot:TRINITY_DN1034_c0_g1_i1.p1 TRINITY_DN1034_c0_g1~~TRINITY_DN1034_c0_g1_i1.p1  ORF type:complete len:588 (+),score=147.71 TRINITY_DN1034_c0_g1_i1:256-2019(+)